MKFLNSVIAVLILSGCCTKQPYVHPDIPASLTSPCEPLETIQGLTGKDVLINVTTNAAIHYRCVDKYNALVDAVSSKEATKNK